ncbi:hypothetical protein AMATHDRAFT_43207 [Amanita thiersii Skay4041]|uniref:DUF6533 domain-containing protein n=1 Tax=Amanita thiersii Skay4041 TaxID=703135 RepID=A0A2A9NH35_9AGAR|nr:hypothetical protein AMATHDRAFT_43207 [Amanita thiersii Skay4041]
MPPSLLSQIIRGLEIRQLTSYIQVASMTLLLYDHLLTMDLEIDYVWALRLSPVSILYYIARLLAYLEFTLGTLVLFMPAKGIYNHCHLVLSFDLYLFVIGTAFGEAILGLRVWAVWNRNRTVGFGLLLLFLGISAGGLISIACVMRSLKVLDISAFPPNFPGPGGITGCFTTELNNAQLGAWVCLLVWDTAVFVLLLIQGLRIHKSHFGTTHSKLFRVIFWDGVMYFLYMFALSVVNLIAIYSLPKPDYSELLATILRVIHVSLTSRVVFRTRAQLI